MPAERILTDQQRLLAERVVEAINHPGFEADDGIRAMISIIAATVNFHEKRPANAEAITRLYAEWLVSIGRDGREGRLQTAPAASFDPRMFQ